MIYGTCYFPTVKDAYLYYAELEGGHYYDSVNDKIASGEIKIGKPPMIRDDHLELRW
jgi:hypothetical protein